MGWSPSRRIIAVLAERPCLCRQYLDALETQPAKALFVVFSFKTHCKPMFAGALKTSVYLLAEPENNSCAGGPFRTVIFRL